MPSVERSGLGIDVADLVSGYSALLFRIAHSVLRSRTEAEDVVQDVFVRVLQHRSALPEVREMRVWLVKIAWNVALDRKRRIRPEQMDEVFAQGLVSPALPADTALAQRRDMQAVLAEIERLSKKERDVLLLCAIEELETVEIALVLGRSESAVRALLFRARRQLNLRLKRKARTR